MAKSRRMRARRALFPKCSPRVAGAPQINQWLARPHLPHSIATKGRCNPEAAALYFLKRIGCQPVFHKAPNG
jgi:hypothetical protein